MLVDYLVTEMVFFYDYLDAAPHTKTMKGNGITTFLLNFSQCIIFNKYFFTEQIFPRLSRIHYTQG